MLDLAPGPLVAPDAPEWPSTTATHPSTAASEIECADRAPVRFVTLGCKVNQYETQFVRELLFANGYREALDVEPAALAVVNTCTVTAHSDRKSRKLITHIARTNPGVRIVVMGCYATAAPEVVRRLPGVAAVITDKNDLAAALRPFGVTRPIRGIKHFEGRQRAFVKVQNGCILNCSFCIIPKVRPGLVSRPIEHLAEEVAGLVESGFREVILTGIHLGHYGLDLSQGLPRAQWRRLWHLLERIARIPGEFRVRLSSLETTEVTDDFVRVLADYQDRVCPHLHLSLQSGSDRILKLMKRRYRISRFVDRTDEIRCRLDQPAFTTDIIVGFPGETNEDFEQTLAVARRVGFSKIHIFPFSARRGTEAASMTDSVDDATVADRRQILSEVEREIAGQYYHSLLGKRLDMLVETPDPEVSGAMQGTACRYAPLRLKTMSALRGRLVPVVAGRAAGGVIDVEPYFETSVT